jgi:hypothetical protein
VTTRPVARGEALCLVDADSLLPQDTQAKDGDALVRMLNKPTATVDSRWRSDFELAAHRYRIGAVRRVA